MILLAAGCAATSATTKSGHTDSAADQASAHAASAAAPAPGHTASTQDTDHAAPAAPAPDHTAPTQDPAHSASAAAPAPGHSAPGGAMHHRFDDPARWAAVFDDPKRDAWQRPSEVIAALHLPPHAKVADLGAGTGYFSVRLAHGQPEATVYAVDVEPNLVAYMQKRAAEAQLPNLVPVLGTFSDAKLPEAVDRVLVVDTYHHVDDRETYFRRLGEKLRPGGELAIIDFRLSSELGPPKQHRLPPEQVISELERAGFHLVRRPEFLPEQYFLIFARAGDAGQNVPAR